ncbi:MAG: helix-turn-helix domain-containing protein [Desulfurococcaceae archaeon]
MSGDNSAEELVGETLSALKGAGFVAETIYYPPESRGFDIIAYKTGSKPLVIKVVEDLRRISKIELGDLKKSIKAYSSVPLLVALRDGDGSLEDDVLYEKYGIVILTVKTLEKSISGSEKPIVMYRKGNYFLKINSRVFREKLREYGYSRSELAELLKVTKKAIYLYERGDLLVPLDKGLLLAELLGEDIFEELDITSQTVTVQVEITTSDTPRDKIERSLWRLASKFNKIFLRFNRTPVDIVVKNENLTIAITKATFTSSPLVRSKIENAEKIADLVNTPLIVIKSHADIKHVESALAKRDVIS